MEVRKIPEEIQKKIAYLEEWNRDQDLWSNEQENRIDMLSEIEERRTVHGMTRITKDPSLKHDHTAGVIGFKIEIIKGKD